MRAPDNQLSTILQHFYFSSSLICLCT